MYFHSIPLKCVRHPEQRWVPCPEKTPEALTGYYPVFLAVGEDPYTAFYLTGFAASFFRPTIKPWTWSKRTGRLTSYRLKEPSEEKLLFRFSRQAFEQLDYQDFHAWNLLMSDLRKDVRCPRVTRRLRCWQWVMTKPSWSEADWQAKARRDSQCVQATTPFLDFRLAEAVYCKTRKAERKLKAMGFQNVLRYRPKRKNLPEFLLGRPAVSPPLGRHADVLRGKKRKRPNRTQLY